MPVSVVENYPESRRAYSSGYLNFSEPYLSRDGTRNSTVDGLVRTSYGLAELYGWSEHREPKSSRAMAKAVELTLAAVETPQHDWYVVADFVHAGRSHSRKWRYTHKPTTTGVIRLIKNWQKELVERKPCRR